MERGSVPSISIPEDTTSEQSTEASGNNSRTGERETHELAPAAGDQLPQTTKRRGDFPRTDAGNAEYFANLFGKKVRYDHKQQRWLIWNATLRRWVEDRQGKVLVLMKYTARQRLKAAPASLQRATKTARK